MTYFFHTTKKIHENLIKSSYSDYQVIYFIFKIKYPQFGDIDHDDMPQEMKKDLRSSADDQRRHMDILVTNICSYCKNYPQEYICQSAFLKTYKEYPYRLHQNIADVVQMLDK
jgi:hypothetical protein